MHGARKWEAKSVECILTGYSAVSKNYIIYVPAESRYIEQAKHVDFLEKVEKKATYSSPQKETRKEQNEDFCRPAGKEIEYLDEDNLIPMNSLTLDDDSEIEITSSDNLSKLG